MLHTIHCYLDTYCYHSPLDDEILGSPLPRRAGGVPPPPPMMGLALASEIPPGMKKRQEVKPGMKMRPLHWSKVPNNKVSCGPMLGGFHNLVM